ncbi:hypothetical protein EJ05DRAFT_47298 [Pseudovirgaria hyperparasitica]|uniref:FAD-binding FR-type domain-containing protein n=1 Tax=Pseudovirgaria hyperparasitica TaxID=470096 RepID=A0A6A6W4Q5_9PEZI|nr:uncharacterized protein EJ05DRAFT_47298 [Pseudovirgaria hyperparasitica]KAF2756900.1 hypothetical protein EJ05DRAFT_47298 [Pseudovirgaria hyperparasitica]
MIPNKAEDNLLWVLDEAIPDLSKRAGDHPSFANVSDLFSFAHGLAGVDQIGNYRWTYVLLLSFTLVCFITLILRIHQMIQSHIRHLAATTHPGKEGKNKQNFWKTNENWYWAKLKKHLFYAPLWKNRHNREWQLSSAINMGTLPSRFHMVLLVLYFGSNLAYCLILPYHEQEKAIIMASLRGRSGTLAAVNLIPTILFALRNNPLIWLLHVSYDTFNLLHRWAARIVVIETVVHTVAWFINTYRAGKWEQLSDTLATTPSYQWGLVGTVMFVSLFFTAWSPVRHAFYETFLNTHRLFAAVGIAGVYVHLDLHRLPQVPWMWIVLLFYGSEWFIRIYQIIYNSIATRATTSITVEALPFEASRVTVKLVRPWHPKPGCHAHIYVPAIALWSSHPFSIAWTHPEGTADDKEKMDVESLIGRRTTTHTISFICRAREGMTRKLYEKAANQPNHIWHTWGAVEGPYGGHDKLNSYGTIMLFAGGVGITHQINFVQEMIKGYEEGIVACKKLILVWTIPKVECCDWIKPWMDQILRMPGRRDILKIMVFISKPNNAIEVVSPSESVRMFPGRCDPQRLIDKEIRERDGAMAVTVCGPGVFADSVRAAVRNRVDVGVIDFIEEAFSY